MLTLTPSHHRFMAMIELADAPLRCSQIYICLDRSLSDQGLREVAKSMRWVGFELATLEGWAEDPDETSDKWLFMSMEV